MTTCIKDACQEARARLYEARQESEVLAARLAEAHRAVQNCLLVVPDGKFKDDMNRWLDQQLGITSDSAPAFSPPWPDATLRIEQRMTNPPRPVWFVVCLDGKPAAGLTHEQLTAALADWDRATGSASEVPK